ncbi:MAG: pitrilysin family protein [Sphingomonadales bacterium]
MTKVKYGAAGLVLALAGVFYFWVTDLSEVCGCLPPPKEIELDGSTLNVPVTMQTLDNGLKVVYSADHSVPTATVGVYYNIGFRIEPKGRTGFAHLFEHMMFQGSANLGKMEFIQLINGLGGSLNGSTRLDYTNYYEVFPAHKLETVLWAEADRMRGLDITQDNLTNQQEVVKNEVRVNVLNRAYGGFMSLDMPQYAFENWYNSHNFYGDMEDLDAANLDDVAAFFKSYYSPNNAVLIIAGDFEEAEAKAFVEKYFANIPSTPRPGPVDVSEPRQREEKWAVHIDDKAPRPALAFAYHMPDRGTPEYFAMGIIEDILLGGEDSLLQEELVRRRGLTGGVSGGINIFGNLYDYDGPMLMTMGLIHDAGKPAEEIMAVVDEVIGDFSARLVTPEEMNRARIRLRSGLYGLVDSSTRFGLVGLLAAFTIFDNNPGRINEIEADLMAVTPELIQKTAAEYLSRRNRTVLLRLPTAMAEARGVETGRIPVPDYGAAKKSGAPKEPEAGKEKETVE